MWSSVKMLTVSFFLYQTQEGYTKDIVESKEREKNLANELNNLKMDLQSKANVIQSSRYTNTHLQNLSYVKFMSANPY